jgi:hypothetical protein
MNLTAPQRKLLLENEKEEERDPTTDIIRIHDCPDCGRPMDLKEGCISCLEEQKPARNITARLERQDLPPRNRT